jgi:menaquinone-dependent protoporphyrinogen oxidase
MRVLVGYASAHGSTRGVAERVATMLVASGVEAEVHSMDEPVDVAAFDAAVLGSAVHDGRWLPEGADFVARNAGALATRPVWLFSVGTLGDHSSALGPRATRKFQAMYSGPKDLPRFGELIHHREHRGFAGVMSTHDWPWRGRMFFRLMGGTYGDHRPWPEIDAWAESIAHELVGSAHART